PTLRVPLALFALAAAAIVGAWAFIGAPVTMPQAPLAKGEKMDCVSYAPFRGNQSPFDPTVHIDPWQIEDDIARLALITNCVRTYSIELGLDRVVEIAKQHGIQVLLGLWVSNTPAKNEIEKQKVVELANRYPDTIRAIVVGNEVLLRGEMSAQDL